MRSGGIWYKRDVEVRRYHTLGAVVPDLQTLTSLVRELRNTSAAEPVVLARRRDLEVVRLTLPGCRVLSIEAGISRRQWVELGSVYFTCTTVDAAVAPVNLLVGVGLQILVTLGFAAGVILYRRRSHLRERVLGMGLPEEFALRWTGEMKDGGFALILVTVLQEKLEVAEEAFLARPVRSPLAVDRRLVL
ncbi:hypothetical protein [Rubrobacter calidifluminis]|uniref:hypothetical protein n=1 Tax=Rubrobacter calidifluminis TaxID=1392640 RepID=UPI002361AD54|nr:hypothetical protein [Rubrobacter calidifluminis]